MTQGCKRAAGLGLAAVLLSAAPAAAQAPQGELSFTFGTVATPCQNPNAIPWSDQEVATLQQQIAVYYPIAKAVYGNPFDTHSIQICKVYLPGDVSGGYGYSVINLEGLRPTALVHEFLHGFHGASLARPIFEEGLVEAATVKVTSLACGSVDCSADPFAAIRLFHSGTSQVYYDGENVPEAFSPDGHYPGNGSFNTHYRLGDYALSKLEIESPGFFRAFNEAYFAAVNADPSIRWDLAALKGIARQLAPAVEGRAFEDWFADQHVFDTVPLPGPGLWQARDVRSDFVPPDQFVTVFLWGADLGSRPGETLSWTVHDNGDQALATGTDVTDASGRIVVRFPDGYYTGSARLDVAGAGAAASQFWPLAPTPGGIFGVVPHAGGGTVSVGLDGAAEPPVEAPVVAGYFTVPALEAVAGRFRLTYRTPTGGTAERIFTKDASRYYVLLKLPDLVAAAPEVAGGALSPGDLFAVSAAVANQGDAASPTSQVRLYLSADGVRDDGDILVGATPLPALPVGGSATATVTAVVPPDAPPGAFHVVACANDPETLAETDVPNDCAASSGTVEVLASYAATVQPPLRADGTSSFRANRGALPIKFALRAGGAETCALPPATIALQRLGGASGPEDVEVLPALPSDVGSSFRVSDCLYVYNLAATALGPGTYGVEIRIGGAPVGAARFELR